MIHTRSNIGPPQPPPTPHGWKYDTVPLADNVRRSFTFTRLPNGYIFYLPFWLPAAVFVLFAAIPWLSFKRFSLRTLLIATTLVAVVRGLIAWASRG